MGNGTKQKRPTIGRGSERAGGDNIETIRYYERIELLPKPPRTDGGFRLYSEDQIKRLRFIRRSRELGFHLDGVRELLRLVDNNYTCAEVKSLTLAHLAEIKRKISDLEKLAKVLKDISSQCEGDNIPDCPVIDALSD